LKIPWPGLKSPKLFIIKYQHLVGDMLFIYILSIIHNLNKILTVFADDISTIPTNRYNTYQYWVLGNISLLHTAFLHD